VQRAPRTEGLTLSVCGVQAPVADYVMRDRAMKAADSPGSRFGLTPTDRNRIDLRRAPIAESQLERVRAMTKRRDL
jgi:hypothetical protein